MTTRKTCEIEPFRYQSTPQIDAASGASSNQINEQALEDYLARLKEAVCADIDSILAECCGGGGGGATTFLELTDTPASYAGQAAKVVSVNAGATALEFTTPSAGGGGGLHKNYSTSEQATDRTWIDGRTIYQRTYDFGLLPNATTKSVAHNITGLDRMIAWETVAKDTTGGATGQTQFFCPAANSASLANQIQHQISADGTSIVIRTGSNRATFYAYVTLFYVKTP